MPKRATRTRRGTISLSNPQPLADDASVIVQADDTLREVEAKDATRHVRLYIKPGDRKGASVDAY